MSKITELQDRLVELKGSADAIIAKAAAESRDLTEDESSTVEGLLADYDATDGQRALLERVEGLNAKAAEPTGRKTKAVDTVAVSDGGSRVDVKHNHGTWDWPSFGDFARAVRRASADGGLVDPRLTARMAPTTYGSEDVGADGGFAVPPDFRAEIKKLIDAEDSLIPRCDQYTSSSNHFTVPKDVSTPWQTTGGILAYWDGEVQQYTQSKPTLQTETTHLDKLTCLIPVSDELLEDAPALDAYLRRKAPEKMVFKTNLAIVQGTGVGQPNGILSSGSLITASQEGSQAADTIVFENIVNMWVRLYAPCRPRSIWLINQDIEAQLMTMEFTGTNSSVPAYLPANGLAGSPYGTLLGRPVIPTQACETLGDLGDIMLVDLSQYMLVQKTGGLRSDVSIHLFFDYSATAFRFVWRVGGRPWWSAAASPRDGSSTLSPFVTLEARTG